MPHSTRFLVALALLTPALPLHAATRTWREQSEFVRDTHGVAMLTVDDSRGSVTITPSSDDRIHLKALKVVRSRTLDEAKRVAAETLVELDDSPGRMIVRVRYPHLHVHLNLWENMSGEGMPNDEVRLEIELPSALAVEINTASADIATDGVRGSQRLRSASGDVRVSGAAGPLTIATASGDVTGDAWRMAQVTTASGDVELDGASGAIALETTSGDVGVHHAEDSLRVRTVSGGVRVDGAPRGADIAATSGTVTLGTSGGRVRAHTVSGDLDARLGRGLQAAELGTQSGALAVTLDPTLACTLEAHSGSGEVNLEGSAQITRHGRGSTIASYRGGGAPVGLRTVSGDIRVVVGGGR